MYVNDIVLFTDIVTLKARKRQEAASIIIY